MWDALALVRLQVLVLLMATGSLGALIGILFSRGSARRRQSEAAIAADTERASRELDIEERDARISTLTAELDLMTESARADREAAATDLQTEIAHVKAAENRASVLEERLRSLAEGVDVHVASRQSYREQLLAAEVRHKREMKDMAGRGTAQKTEIARLTRALAERELEAIRLESGAVAAWDTTVPKLERRIADLIEENTRLRTGQLQLGSSLGVEIDASRALLEDSDAGDRLAMVGMDGSNGA